MSSSLRAAEDVEAVFDQDPQRICIFQGPVAAKWSMVKDEPVKDLLGNINKARPIQRLLERKYGSDKSSVPTIDYLAVQPKTVPKSLPGVTRTEAGNTATLSTCAYLYAFWIWIFVAACILVSGKATWLCFNFLE